MSEMLRGVVACHGRLAEALIDATERISGVSGALVAVTNTDCDRGLIERRIADAVGPGPAVVFTDLASGSCLIAAATLARRQAEGRITVVTGVNLAMLIDFVFHRELPLAEVTARIAGSGRQAIQVP
jgi:mannose/fructose-specific phosphotransferase system component IIA